MKDVTFYGIETNYTWKNTNIQNRYINVPCSYLLLIQCDCAGLLCLIPSKWAKGKMSLPVVNWAYRFLMCQVVALQMSNDTFFQCISLCFLFKANEVGLPLPPGRESLPLETLGCQHSQSPQRGIILPSPTNSARMSCFIDWQWLHTLHKTMHAHEQDY